MERLELASDDQRESRDRWVEHLRAEAAELRREIASEDD
jgi:F0F1-type ATP synthase membrane subunit b/b'